MANHDIANDPQIIQVSMGLQSYLYVRKLLENGALDGALGQMQLSPEIQPLIEAMHHVLAGGEATVQVTRPGNPALVQTFLDAASAATSEGNVINAKTGYYAVTV